MSRPEGDSAKEVADWWRTEIIDMKPGVIRFRGRPIEALIGSLTLPQMIWLMLRGDVPSAGQARLLEAALVAAVDHGPQAPSIATARMAVTCGVALNNALASAVNMLGDIHGGAGEQAVALYHDIAARQREGARLEEAVREGIAACRA
ncbi:MAG: citryl-CoA lyase, partial [Alphaproteobacteria bacterium]